MKKRRGFGLSLDIQKAQELLDEEISSSQGTTLVQTVQNENQVSQFAGELMIGSNRSIHENAKVVELTKVDDHVYISNMKTAEQIEVLQKEGITHVVNLIAHKISERATKQVEPTSSVKSSRFNPKYINANSTQKIYARSPMSKDTKTELELSQHQKIIDDTIVNKAEFQKNLGLLLKENENDGEQNLFEIREQSPNQIANQQQQKQYQEFSFSNVDQLQAPKNDIKYLMLSMRDQIDSDITFYMYATIDFIENAIKESEGKAKILVHCFKGNSRSAAVVAAYYMWKKGMSDSEAIEFVRQKRGFIDPNLGFVGQLMMLNKKFQKLRSEKAQVLGAPNIQSQRSNQSAVSNSLASQRQLFNPYKNQPAKAIQPQLKRISDPRAFTYTLTKERILVKNFNNKSNTKQTALDIKNQLQEYANKYGPLCLVQIDQCFVLLVTFKQDKEYTKAITQTIEKGVVNLLKLAQFLCKYEKGPSLGYIYREYPPFGQNKPQQSMTKIPNITKVKLKYPDYTEKQNLEENIGQNRNTHTPQMMLQQPKYIVNIISNLNSPSL